MHFYFSLSFRLEEKDKTLWYPQQIVRKPQRSLEVHGDSAQITAGLTGRPPPVPFSEFPQPQPWLPQQTGPRGKHQLEKKKKKNFNVLLNKHHKCLHVCVITLFYLQLTPYKMSFAACLWGSTISPASSPHLNQSLSRSVFEWKNEVDVLSNCIVVGGKHAYPFFL